LGELVLIILWGQVYHDLTAVRKKKPGGTGMMFRESSPLQLPQHWLSLLRFPARVCSQSTTYPIYVPTLQLQIMCAHWYLALYTLTSRSPCPPETVQKVSDVVPRVSLLPKYNTGVKNGTEPCACMRYPAVLDVHNGCTCVFLEETPCTSSFKLRQTRYGPESCGTRV
jgi:hypothetical protein